MMNAERMPSIDEIKNRLTTLFKEEGLQLVLLFGSAGSGRSYRKSDIDLAFLFDEPLDILTLTNRVIKLLHTNNVDVVDLRWAIPFLKFSIANNGWILYERSPGLFNGFGEGFLLSFCALHYVVLFLMVLNTTEWGADKTVQANHLSGRHVLPLLLISIYWIGEGFFTIRHWVSKRGESYRFLVLLESKRKSTLVLVILFILILAIVLPKTLRPQRYERLTEKWAGVWIKNQSGQGVKIFTTMPRVAFYADGECEHIDFKRDKSDRIETLMTEKKAQYFVIRGRETIDYPQEIGFIEKHFAEAIRFEEKGMEKIIIYKRVQ